MPEFGQERTLAAFLNLFLLLLVAMAVCSAIVCAIVGLFALLTESELARSTYLIIATVTPFAALLLGYLAKDSLTSPGSRIAEGALTRETTSLGPGYGRDDQAAQVGFGCLLFLLQTLACGIYASAAGLLSYARPGHGKESELAVSIVAHLLEHGATPTADLVESLAEQGITRDRVGATLDLLRKASILEPSPDRLALSPFKRHVFDGCL